MGSFYKQQHTGTFGPIGTLSFNGNKVLTTGGGGMILCRDPDLAAHAKHLTTTAKRPHAFEFVHDELGYNYRMPNINAALGLRDSWNNSKASSPPSARSPRATPNCSAGSEWQFFVEAEHRRSNYWLNAVICEDRDCARCVAEADQRSRRGHASGVDADAPHADVRRLRARRCLQRRVAWNRASSTCPSSVPVAEVA
jgi:dTDP-4-amino-4,6-dideoxygalactose transaminase